MNTDAATISAGKSAEHLSGKRALVVDDDGPLLDVVTRVLERAGMTVKAAGGVADAINIIAEKADFDVVLTDLRMPVTSGKSVLSVMRSILPDVPVLIMSGFWTEEVRRECLDLGADGLLAKPIHADQLLASVADAVRDGRGGRQGDGA